MTKNWMSKHLTLVEAGEWHELAPDTLHYSWCCDCNLRHIEEFRVVKNKEGDLITQRRYWRDDYATELRRRYNKLKAQPVRRRRKR